MYLQELVEVAIGLVFAWLLLSIAILQVQEIIAHVLAKRSKDLEDTIRGMLDDPNKVEEFYNHPLIKSLSKPKSLNDQEKARLKELEAKGKLTIRENFEFNQLKPRPSYIPSSTFTTALFDVVINAGTNKSPIQELIKGIKEDISDFKEGDKEKVNAILEGIAQLGDVAAKSKAGIEFQEGVKTELKKQITRLGDNYKDLKRYSEKMIEEVDNAHYDLGALFKSDLVLNQLRIGTKALIDNENQLGKSLNSLFTGVEEYAADVDHALALGRKNVEEWFDNTMDRMSGWYKRWAQTRSFFIALVIAIIFNIDSIYLAQELWRNPAMREATTVYIQNYVDQKTKANVDLTDTDLNTIESQIKGLGFPVGWEQIKNVNFTWQFIPLKGGETKNIIDTWSFLLIKLIGWLITAGAAMQGAPFWFDTLKKLVNIRSTGTNPAEKPKESTSDKER